MRLLVVTQKVDIHDDLLGFFHQWIAEFAKHCEFVTVICLEKGEYKLPANVRVLSLGKEVSSFKFQVSSFKIKKRIKYSTNFYGHIWHERNNYDSVFVHMNTEYVVLAGWLWRLLGKKIALWHVHFEVNPRLWIAEKFAHVIFTTTPDGCRVRSRKVHAIGHGIDVARFVSKEMWETQGRFDLEEDKRGEDGKRSNLAQSFPQDFKEPIRLLYAGKITPIKNVHVLVDAARILSAESGSASGGEKSWGRRFVVDIVGPPTDPTYDAKLRAYIAEKNLSEIVRMHGRVPYSEMPVYYASADAVVNMCPTGGMDKTVLEGLASRTLAVVANDAFRELFGEYADALIYPYQNAEELAEKIKTLFSKNDEELARMRQFLHGRMKRHSSLETRIPLIVGELKNLWETQERFGLEERSGKGRALR